MAVPKKRTFVSEKHNHKNYWKHKGYWTMLKAWALARPLSTGNSKSFSYQK